MLTKTVTAIVMIGLCQFASANPEAADRSTLIKEVLKVTGIEKQIQQLPSMIRGDLARSVVNLSPRYQWQLEVAIDEAFRPDLIYQSIYDSYDRQFDRQRFTELLDMQKNPLVERMSHMEEDTQKEDAEEFHQFITYFHSDSADPNRVVLINRLVKVSGIAEITVDTQLAAIKGLTDAINPALPARQQHSNAQLKDIYSRLRSNLLEGLEKVALMTTMYVYQPASDAEIVSYTDLKKSETAQWATNLRKEAMVDALTDIAHQAGERISEVLIRANAI
ncbi:MAG: hypothetical protein GXP10_02260 [Gammaproteobacteria bacterium]|nr:hypothetical protein [Gammaproteobacteria bacterium]